MRKLLYVLALLAVAGCKKAPADMGPVGANTLFCQIDGRDFTPYLPASSQPFTGPKINPLGFGYDKASRTMSFYTRTVNEYVTLGAELSHGVGTYPLRGTPYGANADDFGGYVLRLKQTDPYIPVPDVEYYTDAANPGSLTITRFDTVAHVLGGTFAYTAREAATGKVVRITNGRFDVKLP